MTRKRRCVRIEAVDEAGHVREWWWHIKEGSWRWCSPHGVEFFQSATAIWREIRSTYPGWRIRKVYEDAPREEAK